MYCDDPLPFAPPTVHHVLLRANIRELDSWIPRRTLELTSSLLVSDNAEGLDMTALDGDDGEWEVMLAWPEDSSGCGPFGDDAHEASWSGSWAFWH